MEDDRLELETRKRKVLNGLIWVAHRFVAVVVGVPYNVLTSASYYMMYNMYMIDEDLRSIGNGIRVQLRSPINKGSIGKAIGWALWGAAVPVLRVLALPIFALYGACVGALLSLAVALAPAKQEQSSSNSRSSKKWRYPGLDAVLKIPYFLLIKQRELDYAFVNKKHVSSVDVDAHGQPGDKKFNRQDYKKFTYFQRWVGWACQDLEDKEDDSPLVFTLPVRPRHALMLALVVGMLSALVFTLLAMTGGFGLVGFIVAHTGISFALTSYVAVNTVLAGLTVGAVSSLGLSVGTYVMSLIGWRIGHAIEALRQYWRGDRLTVHVWGKMGRGSDPTFVSLLHWLVGRTLFLIWQSLGIILATTSLLIFSPVVRVLRLTADVTEFSDKTARRVCGLLPAGDKTTGYHLINGMLTLFGFVYFMVMLPVAVARGVVFAFVNGYIAGSHGLRTGLSAVTLHTDLSRAVKGEDGYRVKGDIDPADFEQLGIESGKHTLVTTLVFLMITMTILTVLAVVFFPPAAHMAVTVLSTLGMPASSFSLPVLTVASGSGAALGTGVLGALAEFALMVVRALSNKKVPLIERSLVPESRIKTLDKYDVFLKRFDKNNTLKPHGADNALDQGFENVLEAAQTVKSLLPSCGRSSRAYKPIKH